MIAVALQTTPGGSIKAGQISNDVAQAPEPGTMALSLLAAGAAGVAEWKRRRKSQQA